VRRSLHNRRRRRASRPSSGGNSQVECLPNYLCPAEPWLLRQAPRRARLARASPLPRERKKIKNLTLRKPERENLRFRFPVNFHKKGISKEDFSRLLSTVPVYGRRVNSLLLVCSLSSHRYSYTFYLWLSLYWFIFSRCSLFIINSKFQHAHREPSALANEIPEESEQFRFLRAACFGNIKGSVGLILVKTSAMRISIPLDLSSRSFIPLPCFMGSRRVTPLLPPSLVFSPRRFA
jgi:hypothetical protein